MSLHSIGQCFTQHLQGSQVRRSDPSARLMTQATGAGDRAFDSIKCWLSGGVQGLGEPVVVELLLDWLYLFLTVEEHEDAVPMSRQ